MNSNYSKIISLLIVIATIYYSFSTLLPSEISDANTPEAEFSTERALIQLKEITKKPHYVGSDNHETVKNYLISQLKKMGLEVEVQKQMAVNKKWRAAVNAQNIIAKIKGVRDGKALLLLTHYDSSIHSSLGASDAGSGVVTILESVRTILARNQEFKNDIIILITDAEELGLLGANAFVNHHPWAKDVGLVLNFEARGSGGPSYMLLETNGGNQKLIEAFNKAKSEFPVANSLMYSIYKMLPNDTDLTVFREEGDINGFNFAFIDDHFDYHTAQDSYENMDRNTLEHQGSYLMSLLPYFANADLENLNSSIDYVYFNFPKMGLVSYPFTWVLPMWIVAIFLFIAFVFIGIKKDKLSFLAIFTGFIPFIGSMVLSTLIAVYGWKLIKIIHPQYNEILHGFTYNGHTYIIAFSALTLAILFLMYKKFFKNHKPENLIIAPIFVWLIINTAVLVYLKGSGFFILPVYFALATLAVLIFARDKEESKLLPLITFLAIPTMIIFAPLIKMFPVGLGLGMLGISALFIVLIFGLMIPIFQQINQLTVALNKIKIHSYPILFVLTVLLFISASFKSNYNTERKQPTSLLYVLDADSEEAYWASYESQINDYNRAYLGQNAVAGSFDKNANYSKYLSRYKIHKKTDVIDIPFTKIKVVMDTVVMEERKIRLQFIPQRKASLLNLMANNTMHFSTFKINGVSLKKNQERTILFDTERRKSIFTYYFTEDSEIIDFEFSISKDENPSLMLYEVSYELFTNSQLNVKPRNNDSMFPTPFVINDATIVKKSIVL